MKEDRHCLACGAIVEGHHNKLYCSWRCRPPFVAKPSTGACLYCQAPLQSRAGEPPSRVLRRNYCDHRCYSQSNVGRRMGEP